MPTYEYHCDSCDRNFDVVQSFHDDPLGACPTCGSPVRKVFGSVGIVFKGSGFYKTDSRSAASTKAGDGGAGSAADGGDSKRAASDSGGSGSGDGATSPAAPAAPAKSDSASSPAATPSASGNGSAPSAKESAKT